MQRIDRCAAQLQRRFGPHVLCDVVSVEGDCSQLLPQEQQLVEHAVPSRRREFAAGRVCARGLLVRLGSPPRPLLCAPDRTPLWPDGAVGSIAHDDSLCAVAVARAQLWSSIGLDAEPDAPLEPELWDTVCTPRELAMLSTWPRELRGRTARILFSAKECTYKCLYPLAKVSLELREVEIEVSPWSDVFRASVRRLPGVRNGNGLKGFHFACGGTILCGMALAAAPAPLRTVVT